MKHEVRPGLKRALDIASQARIGVYDCLYVALAERAGCELVTADDRLVRAPPANVPVHHGAGLPAVIRASVAEESTSSRAPKGATGRRTASGSRDFHLARAQTAASKPWQETDKNAVSRSRSHGSNTLHDCLFRFLLSAEPSLRRPGLGRPELSKAKFPRERGDASMGTANRSTAGAHSVQGWSGGFQSTRI